MAIRLTARRSSQFGRILRHAAGCALAIAAGSTYAAARQATPPPATVDTSRGFTMAYADGRTSTQALRDQGGMWTPHFPRITGAETRSKPAPRTAGRTASARGGRRSCVREWSGSHG